MHVQTHKAVSLLLVGESEGEMGAIYNGMPCSELGELAWRKSRHSNPNGNCVELAELPDGGIAMRNSRHPGGPVLVYAAADMEAFVRAAKAGQFDDLIRD